MNPVYSKVMEYVHKYHGGVAWRLRKHSAVVELHLNPDEEELSLAENKHLKAPYEEISLFIKEWKKYGGSLNANLIKIKKHEYNEIKDNEIRTMSDSIFNLLDLTKSQFFSFSLINKNDGSSILSESSIKSKISLKKLSTLLK